MSSCSESEPFALQVLDDSMAPEFTEGAIIIVEPTGVVEDGAFVVAYHGDGVILRQLRIDADAWRLVALDGEHADIAIEGIEQIRGRVVQRAGRRRRDRKTYA